MYTHTLYIYIYIYIYMYIHMYHIYNVYIHNHMTTHLYVTLICVGNYEWVETRKYVFQVMFTIKNIGCLSKMLRDLEIVKIICN
jgi:hypothetical protein